MSKSKILSNPWVVAVLALFCAALWGSATPFIKIGYELILPEKNVPSTILFAGVRFFFTGVITVLIYSIASGKLLYPQKSNIGSIAMVLIGIVFGGKIVVSGGQALGVLTYLSFLSAAAYAIWGVLLKNNPVSRVTVYSFMTPVMGVLLSNLLLTEQNGVSALNLVVTLVLVCAGILILNYKKA